MATQATGLTTSAVDHLKLTVTDVARSRDFYTSLLEQAVKLFDERGIPHGEITPLEAFGITVLMFRDPDNIQIELTAPSA